ncbi:MAG: 23S rRNA (uracil(1939)-C(5))-methyltransferase RlmD [Candidatus Gastranaerophilales bacterium]|nr:23S rRNA (uracil(1939)-C(5))-methyltransferase RlmD [Candidatus Gastranaerophilales bacterium]
MTEYVVKIEKMINEGNGLARLNNIPIFIDGVCPNETVKVKIVKENKNYLLGELVEVVEPSKSRVKPLCSLHNACGSCNWQHIDYQEQLIQKQNIVKETLKKIAGYEGKIDEIISSPLQKEYRCKIQMPVSQTKVSKRILAGYFKKNSHELINIKYCPMQPSIINEINEFIKEQAQELNIQAYDEKKHTGILRHIIYKINSTGTEILISFVINSEVIDTNIKKLAQILFDNYTQIVGVCANLNTKKTNVILGKETKSIVGKSFYTENLSGIKYQISANSFFQVNPLCAEKIFNRVKELISSKISNPTILDAYSGVSSFGIWLSDIASRVVSIEEVESASKDAMANIKLNNIKNLDVVNGDAAIEFQKLIDNDDKFDVSITDPPRKGCTIDSIENIVKLTNKYIVYVSCNVSTLARDMKLLNEKGFKTVFVQPADLFPNTYHVETIALFEKAY